MSLVEEACQRAVDAMTPQQKLARMHAMLRWVRELYARQVRAELGHISEERLKWEVALRQYRSDAGARELIEKKLREIES